VAASGKHLNDLYDKFVRKYVTQLEALRPVVDIPIMT